MAAIRLDISDSVATVTLDRPDKLNAFTTAMGYELIEAFDTCDRDDAVRAVVLTGAGRAFCAGADLSAGAETFVAPAHAATEDFRDGGGELVLRMFEFRKPIIAAINGPAVGVGITMTLAADFRLARRITEHSAPVSVALSRQMLWRGLGADHPMTAHRVESRGIHSRGASADAKEGVSSFLEKRPARYPDSVARDLPDIFGDDLPVPPFRR
ncbi:enoyl-CoA hydratase-related protein [Nocardia grenadensis]|uniref:enoyl-CoA hydratase-related protein n=1 Tax=Nocardia grenadensis TaxID=931537 RepID=UPI003D8DD09F